MKKEKKSNKELLSKISELEKELETYKMIADFTSDWETFLDKNGRYTFISASSLKITGYSPTEFLEDPDLMDRIIHPEDLEKFKNHQNEVSTPSKEIHHLTFRIFTKSGELKWLEHYCQTAFDINNNWLGQRGSNRDITERIEAENKIKENDEQFQKMFQEHSAVFFLIDPNDGKILGANNAAEKFTGYSTEKLKKMNIADINILATKENHNEMDNSTTFYNNYVTFKHKLSTGKVREVEMHSSPIKLNNRNILFSIIHDVSERKKIEKALTESEEKLRTIFDILNIGIAITDDTGKLTDCNRAYEKLFGISKQNNFNRIYTTDEWGLIRPDFSIMPLEEQAGTRALKEGKAVTNIEMGIQKRIDKITWILANATPLALTNHGVVITCIDITEIKEASQQLKEKEERLKLSIESAKEGTWDWDVSNGNMVLNKYWAEMLGYTIEEIDPHINSLRKIMHPDDTEFAMESLNKHLIGESDHYESEYRLKTKSGNWKWVLSRGKVIEREDQGNALRIIGTHVDINELKLANEKLKNLSKELQTLNSTKNKFFSIIAHDLRGPVGSLNSLLNYITTNERNVNSSEFTEDLLLLKDTSKVISNLLENLLTWASAQRGEIRFYPTINNLHKLIQSNIKLFSSVAENKKIEIINDSNPNLTGFFDYNMINTVIRNLLNNATKYSKEDGKIIISARENSNNTIIIVKDNGVGMKKSTSDNLFRIDVKHRSMEGTKGEKGSGLGLILCKEFIEKHGGRIWVESEFEKGAEFKIILPKINQAAP